MNALKPIATPPAWCLSERAQMSAPETHSAKVLKLVAGLFAVAPFLADRSVAGGVLSRRISAPGKTAKAHCGAAGCAIEQPSRVSSGGEQALRTRLGDKDVKA